MYYTIKSDPSYWGSDVTKGQSRKAAMLLDQWVYAQFADRYDGAMTYSDPDGIVHQFCNDNWLKVIEEVIGNG